MTDPPTDQPARGATPASLRAGDGSRLAQPVAPAADPAQYRERLRTPPWWYAAAVLVGLLMASEFLLASSGWITYLPFAVLVPGCVGLVWRLSSATVTVANGTVSVADRTLAVTEIAQGFALDRVQLRMLVGRHSDPLAYDFIRSWIGPGVQLVLSNPPQDGTETDESQPGDPAYREPYWVLSTRHPDRLLAAIAASGMADSGTA